jgi:putative glycosyl hydrolase-like family 6 (GHL6) protein/glycosyl hydrolase family 42 (putative beta-galactosidase)
MNRRTFLGSSAASLASVSLSRPVFASQALHGQSDAEITTTEMPYRQVHLDFHTSELIPDVAKDFKALEFLETLQRAHVNSINLFAKCHHGWAYYDTTVAHRHPNLTVDLLSQQINTLRPAGITVNYYYSLVWDNRSALATPEWRARDRSGNGIQTGYWPWMCMNTPYLDQVLRENEEILDRWQVDGAWWDILIQPPDGCFCTWCVADRKMLGLSDSPQDIYQHNKMVALKTERVLYSLLKRKQEHAIAFFNSRLVVGISDELQFYTNLQIESLPSGGWGYTHFEHRVRYCRTLGKEMIGMTGRFHKSWGDFGGFKPQAALDFECLNFLANGAKACIGDQLHPRGKLDERTYSMIGQTYERVRRQEEWVQGLKGTADIGVVSVLATKPDMATQTLPPSDEGVTNMLVELHHQFDVLDLNADLKRYKLIILPDEIDPIPELVEKIQQYLLSGGALLVTYRSFLLEEQGRFALNEIGATYNGASKFRGEYMLLQADAFLEIGKSAFYLYQPGLSVTAAPGAQVLAVYGHPYFDRSPQHWCSHAQTPVETVTTEPVILRNGSVTYCANPFFRSYAEDGELIQKLVMKDLIGHLLPEPLIRETGIPSTARLTLLESSSGGRQLIQILYAPYERRAFRIDVIEEFASVLQAEVQVRRISAPHRVRAMDGAGNISEVPMLYQNGYVKISLPRVAGSLSLLVE